MKTITEIFKTNPELLDAPEVKELVEQFSIQFKNLQDQKDDFWNNVTDITMNSEFYVINGTPCKESLIKIHELAFR